MFLSKCLNCIHVQCYMCVSVFGFVWVCVFEYVWVCVLKCVFLMWGIYVLMCMFSVECMCMKKHNIIYVHE